ncbi:MAG: hypothetical protein R3243_15590 [Arenibacter latericius]|nr:MULTISPECIES: hypothetical protein [Arenibacter]MDX1365630.1 hypothetical protein [Arenibacter latericius]
MEKIYSKNQDKCKIATASQETVSFLLSYSKSLQIVDYKNIQFENNLN